MNKTAILTVALLGGAAAAQPASINLGNLNGDLTFSGNLAPNELVWFSFDVGSTGTYIDFTTSFNSDFDTELGLYDAAGNRVANDDDDGIGLTSTLTFGAGSGLLLGDLFNLGGDGIANGEDGAMLGAGTYFLVLGEFQVNHGDTNFDVTSTGTDVGGAYELNIFTNVPTPGALSLLGVAGLVATRRRR